MARKTSILASLAGIAVLLPLASPPASATSAPSGLACFTEWSDAVPVVHREALTAVRDIHSQARRRQLGDVVRVTLCSDDGRFVYRLLVREPKGGIVSMTVDARRPFEAP